MLSPLLQSKGHFVIDVVIEVIVSPYCFLDFISKVHCLLQNSFDLLHELCETNVPLFSLLVSVYEQH